MPVLLSRQGLRPAAAVGLASLSLVVSAAVGSLFLSGALDAWAAVAAPGPAGPADGIVLVTGMGGTALALWLGLGMALSALSALPGAAGQLSSRLAGRVAPVVMRKTVAFILGTTLTAAFIPGTAVASIGHGTRSESVVTSSQQAQPAGSGRAAAAPDASFRMVSQDPAVLEGKDVAPPPSWSPEPQPQPPKPVGRPALRKALAGTASEADIVVVLRGDTLWSIAARHLGPAATVADIEIEWHRWLAANHPVIGDDADLILPGQLLRPPPTQGHPAQETPAQGPAAQGAGS